MASKRVNIVIDEETLELIDAIAEQYHSNRSETIREVFQMADALDLFGKLEEKARAKYAERMGEDMRGAPSIERLTKAAYSCEVRI